MYKAILALIVTIFLWSSGFVAIRIGLQGYGPGPLALFHYLISSIGIFIPFIMLAKKIKHFHLPLFDILKCFIIGVIGFGVYNIALNYGELTVDAGIASFINSQIPISILILSILFLREKISLSIMFGIAISCLGVSLIAYGYSGKIEWQWGILYLLIANICAAIYTVFSKPLLKKYHPLALTAYTIWGGTLSLLFYTPSLWRQVHLAPLSPTLAAIYLGLLPGLVGYSAWNYALQNLPAVRASTMLYAIPLVATIMSWLLLHELPTWITLMGGLIALSGSLLLYYPFRPCV